MVVIRGQVVCTLGGFPNGVLYFSEYRVSLPDPRIFRENLHSFNSIKQCQQQQQQLLLL